MRTHTRSGKPFNNPILGPTFSGLSWWFKSREWQRGMRSSRAWKSAEFLCVSELGRNSSYSWSKGIRGSINTRAHGG
jgi:hypothetical protein